MYRRVQNTFKAFVKIIDLHMKRKILVGKWIKTNPPLNTTCGVCRTLSLSCPSIEDLQSYFIIPLKNSYLHLFDDRIRVSIDLQVPDLCVSCSSHSQDQTLVLCYRVISLRKELVSFPEYRESLCYFTWKYLTRYNHYCHPEGTHQHLQVLLGP